MVVQIFNKKRGWIFMGKRICENEKLHEISVRRARERVLGESETETICSTFKMLSEPSRLKIVLALLNGEMCVYHLAEVCDGTVSAVSHQLRLLKDNGIVRAKRCGKNVEYSLDDGHVREMVELAIEHLACKTGNE